MIRLSIFKAEISVNYSWTESIEFWVRAFRFLFNLISIFIPDCKNIRFVKNIRCILFRLYFFNNILHKQLNRPNLIKNPRIAFQNS